MDDAHTRGAAGEEALPPVNLTLGDGAVAGRLGTAVSPFRFQYRVLKALVLRDIAARHGEYRLGPLVSILMPLIAIGLMIAIFDLRGKVASPNLNFGVFMATGYPMWLAFRGLYNSVMNAASRNDPLLMFPQITQLDLILAKIIYEVALETIVFILLCIGVIIFFHANPPADPMGVLFCFWGCTWIGSAFGMILCAVQRAAPMVVMVINSVMRLGMWVSGVMFSVDRLPSFLLPYVQWNPMLHLIEGSRTLWEPAYDAPIFDPRYVIIIGFVLTTIGFVFERASRRLVGP